MIYCVSDIHGELDKFERLLELTCFSASDHLYVIGDVIDRGTMGVDIIQKIKDTPNMSMLLRLLASLPDQMDIWQADRSSTSSMVFLAKASMTWVPTSGGSNVRILSELSVGQNIR